MLGTDVLEQLDVQAVRAQWERAITAPPSASHRVLVACDGPRVVGFAASAPVEQGIEVVALEVDPDHQRGGHGSRLLTACVDLAREHGAVHLQTWVLDDDAARRPTRVIVLCGGPEFWSNGLDLNLIEAADSAPDESWVNISAIDDLSEAIVRTSSHLTVSALCGNAGAGGVFLARAADQVWLRSGVILNPHYKDMGNLYGSELWTYLLPRHCGAENTRRIAAARLPMGAGEAVRLGLADRMIGGGRESFMAQVKAEAAGLANDPGFAQMLAGKSARRAVDEAQKPLSAYREEELARMHRNFYGFDPSYHIARHNFVHKVPKSRTPVTIARHRDLAWKAGPARRGRAS